jgi:hypothetical protein
LTIGGSGGCVPPFVFVLKSLYDGVVDDEDEDDDYDDDDEEDDGEVDGLSI